MQSRVFPDIRSKFFVKDMFVKKKEHLVENKDRNAFVVEKLNGKEVTLTDLYKPHSQVIEKENNIRKMGAVEFIRTLMDKNVRNNVFRHRFTNVLKADNETNEPEVGMDEDYLLGDLYQEDGDVGDPTGRDHDEVLDILPTDHMMSPIEDENQCR